MRSSGASLGGPDKCLLDMPVELLDLILSSKILSTQDRCNIRLTHSHLRNVIAMKPFISLPIRFRSSSPNAYRGPGFKVPAAMRIHELLSKENVGVRRNIESVYLEIRNMDKVPGLVTFLSSTFPKLLSAIKPLRIFLEVDEFSVPRIGSSTGVYDPRLFILELCSSGVKKIKVPYLRIISSTDLLPFFSNLSSLKLVLSEARRMGDFYNLPQTLIEIAKVITNSPSLRTLKLFSEKNGWGYGFDEPILMSFDTILDAIPPTHDLGIRKLELYMVDLNIKSSNVAKLKHLQNLAVPSFTLRGFISGHTHKVDDIWKGLLRSNISLTSIHTFGLIDDYYVNDMDNTFAYLKSNAGKKVTSLRLQFLRPGLDVRTSKESATEVLHTISTTSSIFWQDVFASISCNLEYLNIFFNLDLFEELFRHIGRDSRCNFPSTNLFPAPLPNPTTVLFSTSLRSVHLWAIYDKTLIPRTMRAFSGCPGLNKLVIEAAEQTNASSFEILMGLHSEYDADITSWKGTGNWNSFFKLTLDLFIYTFIFNLDRRFRIYRVLTLGNRENGLFGLDREYFLEGDSDNYPLRISSEYL